MVESLRKLKVWSGQFCILKCVGKTEPSKELNVADLQESNLFTDLLGLLAMSKAHRKHTNHIALHQLEYKFS